MQVAVNVYTRAAASGQQRICKNLQNTGRKVEKGFPNVISTKRKLNETKERINDISFCPSLQIWPWSSHQGGSRDMAIREAGRLEMYFCGEPRLADGYS